MTKTEVFALFKKHLDTELMAQMQSDDVQLRSAHNYTWHILQAVLDDLLKEAK